eukprot:s1823_g3.t1
MERDESEAANQRPDPAVTNQNLLLLKVTYLLPDEESDLDESLEPLESQQHREGAAAFLLKMDTGPFSDSEALVTCEAVNATPVQTSIASEFLRDEILEGVVSAVSRDDLHYKVKGFHGEAPASFRKSQLWVLLSVIGQLHSRLMRPYQRQPLQLAQLVDQTRPLADRMKFAESCLNLKPCCIEHYFGRPVIAAMRAEGGPLAVLPTAKFHQDLLLSFRSKCSNLELELNFSRAASMRTAMRGRKHGLCALTSKHIVAEVKVGHCRYLESQKDRGDDAPEEPSNLLALSHTCVDFLTLLAGNFSRQTGWSLFLKQEIQKAASNRSQHSESDDWSEICKSVYKQCSADWNSGSNEMNTLKQRLSAEAKQVNREKNAARRSALERYTDYSEDCKKQRAERNHQQQKLVRAAFEAGTLCPGSNPPMIPSSACPGVLADFARDRNIHPITGDSKQPLDEQIVDQDMGMGSWGYGGGTPEHMVKHAIANGVFDSESIHQLLEHAPALFGLGDENFGISEALLEEACKRDGFIESSHRQFAADHSFVCEMAANLGEDESMNVDNQKHCQNVYGRYCKLDIQNPVRYECAVEMSRNIARHLATRRKMKFGQQTHLCPDTPFPVLIIRSPEDQVVYGRLAARVCFKPLEIDWLHCAVTCDNGGGLWKIRPEVDMFRCGSSRCQLPKIDSMEELAVWFSQLAGSWKFQIFWDYELSHVDFSEIVLRPDHEHMEVARTSDDANVGLEDLLPPARKPAAERSLEELQESKTLDAAVSLMQRLAPVRKPTGSAKETREQAGTKKRAANPKRTPLGKRKAAYVETVETEGITNSSLTNSLTTDRATIHSSGARGSGDAVTDDLEDEWEAALDARYGSHCSDGNPTPSSSKQSASSSSSKQVRPDVEGDEILHMYTDEKTKRVIAECASGKKLALGFLAALMDDKLRVISDQF